jgi:hypothetical protein
MSDSEYSRLFGPYVGTGRRPASNFWEAAFANPVGTDIEENRRRLLQAFKTMPVRLRINFLRRLHSSTPFNAVGAWSELEFAALLRASSVKFAWIGEQKDSSRSRPLDFKLDGRVHAEVTHVQEKNISDGVRQLFQLVARESLPEGAYTLTSGEGQPPIRKLRASLKRSSAGAPIEAAVGDWSIRQADSEPSQQQVGDSMWMTESSALMVKVKDALQDKRRQARGAGAHDLVVGILVQDRHAHTLVDLLKASPFLLRDAIKGSGQGASELIVHGLALGIVAGDRFPFVPEWFVFATTDELLLRQLQADYVRLPEGAQQP